MKTIELEVKIPVKEKTKKVVVDLPYYIKSVCHYYKVIDKDTVICVTDSGYKPSIGFSYLDHALNENKTTENQFNMAFNRVMKKINKHVK